VDLIGSLREPSVGAVEEPVGDLTVVGQGVSDGDGRVRCDALRPSGRRVVDFVAMAAVPGYGLGSANWDSDADRPEVEVRLRPEGVVRLRLVGINGAPAMGVEVRVMGFRRSDKPDDEDGAWIGDGNTPPPQGIRAWPGPFQTDDQGRITLRGIGRGYHISLHVRDGRYARQDLDIDPGKAAAGEVTLALEPARIIEGRALADDTGRPIPRAVVEARSMDERRQGGFPTRVRADDQGRFVLNPYAGESYTLHAYPAGGEPFLIPQDELKWTKGAVKATHDIRLRRGVVIRGKVTERDSGHPLAGASIQYIPTRVGDRAISGWQALVNSRDDGSFQVVVPPGKGHLFVRGPTGDYILEEIGANRVYDQGFRIGGQRHRGHAIIPYEVKAGDAPREVAAALRPGATIWGRAEGPDGRPIAHGLVITALHSPSSDLTWSGGAGPESLVRDGVFALHGLDPAGSARISLFDWDHEWGATVEVSGRQAGEELAVRLQPCGKARARLVGPDGRPAANHPLLVEFVATPGPSPYSGNLLGQAMLSADSDFIGSVDFKHYENMPSADAEGRITLVALIPGALYRITDESTANSVRGMQVRKDFTVKPGETLDLGDILIEKP
jgi:hypothetical protein